MQFVKYNNSNNTEMYTTKQLYFESLYKALPLNSVLFFCNVCKNMFSKK